MAKTFEGFAIGFSSTLSTRDATYYARLAERNGIDSFWMAEAYHFRSSTSTAVAVSDATKRISLGLGILNPLTRHPALIAMEAATIDEISNGRLTLGLGTVLTAIKKHGHDLNTAKPVLAVREAVEIIRLFFAGEPFRYEGRIFTIDSGVSKLGFKPRKSRMPIYIGATGPKMLKLAGEVADGLILTHFVSPEFVRYAVREMQKGASGKRRMKSRFPVLAYLILSTDKDSEKARAITKEAIARWIPVSAYQSVTRLAGVEDEDIEIIKKNVVQKGVKEAAKHVSDELVDRLVIAGSPDECTEKLKKYLDAGLTVPIAFDILGPDRRKAMETISKYVLPNLVESKRK